MREGSAGFDVLDRDAVLAWLRVEDPEVLEGLWARADAVRRAHVGDAVHLRGLVEVSNHCVRQCTYCGIRAGNHGLTRYRMSADEVVACARRVADLGYGTIVLQAGEDFGLTGPWVADVVARIRASTPLAVTLSLGERLPDELRAWREAGADRYLLRFETSDAALFDRIHPPRHGQSVARWDLLGLLHDMGYEVGSGVMVGIPGQTWDSLADDVMRFAGLDLDMIGVGPYIPHPDTPLAAVVGDGPDQVPADATTACKVVALARLVRPDANIPATTALGTIDRAHGRELGLRRGANILMPNLTPDRYKACYEIYPDKAALGDPGEDLPGTVRELLRRLGRPVGAGPGGRGNGSVAS